MGLACGGLAYPQQAADALEERWYFDAPHLFMQRARQARPDFDTSSFELPLVLKIRHLVDGLPLGLELAATWVKGMSLAEIAQGLERNSDGLNPARNLERHKSIAAALEHSWKLLTLQEQDVLRKLSFQGGFRREAASKVASATIPVLVDKSRLRVSHDGSYTFHPLLYQCTQQKLARHLPRTG